MMITAQQIHKAKLELNILNPYYEHDDCARMAYEWFDAQMKTKITMGEKNDLGRLIGDWGGSEVSQSDVELAAYLHPGIKGEYPFYNINPRLIFPSAERLKGIGESFRHEHEEQYLLENYRFYEIVRYASNDGFTVVRSYFSEELPESQHDWHDFCTTNDNCKCYYCVYGR